MAYPTWVDARIDGLRTYIVPGFGFEWKLINFPDTLEPGELFTPRIEFTIGDVYYSAEKPSEWIAGTLWQHESIELDIDAVELRYFYGNIAPENAITLRRWDARTPPEPAASMTFVWAPTLTIEDLIGEVGTSGAQTLGFVIVLEGKSLLRRWTVGWWFFMGDNYQIVGDWSEPCLNDIVTADIYVEVPPIQVHPSPVFRRDLCSFPTYVAADETFSPVFVVENTGEAGTFYLAYWYLGYWTELYRGTIAKDATYTHRIDAMRITDWIGPVAQSQYADIRLYAGYIEPETPIEETYTDMLGCALYVEVGPTEIYTCPWCGMTFTTEEELQAHMAVCPERPVEEVSAWDRLIAWAREHKAPVVAGGAGLAGLGVYLVWPGEKAGKGA